MPLMSTMPMSPDERLQRKIAFDGQLRFGAGRFNARTDRLKHEIYRKHNDYRWLDPETGLLATRYARDRDCPLCGRTAGRTLFTKAGFPHRQCEGCSLIYVSPCLTPDALGTEVKSEESYSVVLANPLQLELDELKFAYGLDLISQHVDDDGHRSLCDIGCGPGGFLELARGRGLEILAIEPGEKYHAHLAAKGIPFDARLYPDPAYAGPRWDIVTLWAIFEHVFDPRAFLSAVHENLRPKGLLFICVPNARALVTRLLRERSNTFGGHSHLQFFDEGTLGELLRRSGFALLEMDTMITELGTINNYLAFAEPYAANEPPLLAFLTPQFIYANGLGSLLVAVARREDS